MTEEYIKRSDAILAIQRHGVGSFDFEEDGWTPEQAERFVIAQLNKIRAEDVAPVRRGEWLPEEVFGEPIIYCSKCLRIKFDGIKSNFCPNCGAKNVRR